MKKIYYSTFLLISLLWTLSHPVYGQTDPIQFWDLSNQTEERLSAAPSEYLLGEIPTDYLEASLKISELKRELSKATSAENQGTEDALIIKIPTPDGEFEEFYVYENSIVAPEVAHLYTIKTFEGQSKESPQVHIRCDISSAGFHAYVFDNEKTYIIEPLSKTNNASHIIYYKKDMQAPKLSCGVSDLGVPVNTEPGAVLRTPTTLRTYRLAYVASGEYSQQFGGSPYSTTTVLNSIASGLNLVLPIVQRDLGITFTLVTTASLIFPDPATDPYDLSNQSALISQNHTECTNALTITGFDIGHLLVWANTGGLAAFGACDNAIKGAGFSGSDASISSLFIDYSAHEMGHQFGGDHNFGSLECATSVNNLRFEPGEGSSIMAYAGVCTGNSRYQNSSDPFYHSASIRDIQSFIDNFATCATTSTPGGGNGAAPVPDAKLDITIPKETPFVLVGSATDGNDPSGQLTYLWEQFDGAGTAVNDPPNCNSTTHPLFRFRPPVSATSRVFPEMSQVLSGNNNGVDWEKLPCTARTINFNLIARDNNPNWGRIGNDKMIITVANTGPFAVVTPNGAETWMGNSTQAVTWSVNGTNAHCTNVDVLVSTDNGNTYTVVANGVTNNGTANITVPNMASTTARVLVQCSVGGNFLTASTFFDASNAPFTITSVLPVELTSFDVRKYSEEAVELKWITESEIGNSHFEVQKSTDGINFLPFSSINGKGNSTAINAYRALDKAPTKGINYYRLKQIDFDQQFEYSDIKSIYFDKLSDDITIFPNPANSEITVSMNKEIAQRGLVKLMTVSGQLIHSEIVSFQESRPLSFDLSRLPNGIYLVQAVGEFRPQTKRFVINN